MSEVCYMNIIPAIDIMAKRVVRLEQGKFDKDKVYADNPATIARGWEACGASLLHVVDLDGAREGRPVNLDVVNDIVKGVKCGVELGGGLRSENDIKKALDIGVRFVVVGTSAVLDEAFCRNMIKQFSNSLIFAVDVKDGKVAVRGWKEDFHKCSPLKLKVSGEGIVHAFMKMKDKRVPAPP